MHRCDSWENVDLYLNYFVVCDVYLHDVVFFCLKFSCVGLEVYKTIINNCGRKLRNQRCEIF